MITIDQSKCIQCSQCIRVCPFTILDEVDGYPKFNSNKNCIECLHCVVICPKDAITSKLSSCDSTCFETNSSDKLKIKEDFAEQLEHHIKTRRSIRHFKKETVNEELITNILTTVKMVPSAKNQHPCKWIVVHGREKTQKIMDMVLSFVAETGVSKEIESEYKIGNNIVTLDAPDLLIAYGSESAISPFIDCSIALTSAELLLQANGIGTCWAGYLTRISNASSEISKYLGIPEGNKVFGILAMGYPDKEEYIKIPYRPDSEIKWI